MSIYRFTFLFAALTAGLAGTAQAQLLIPHWSIHTSLAIPQGEFADELGRTGYGLSLFAGVQVRSMPLILGIEGSLYEYGREYFRVPVSYAVPDVKYRMKTLNNFFTAHFVSRVQWRRHRIKPYAEGLIGLKVFYTETSLSNRYGGSEPSTANLTDTAFSYGAGGGVDFFVSRSFAVDIHLHAGVRYLRGCKAEYLKKGAIARTGGHYAHKASRTRTDALMPTFGISFTL